MKKLFAIILLVAFAAPILVSPTAYAGNRGGNQGGKGSNGQGGNGSGNQQ
ncbi:MAG TPA: hypothetical protein VJN67_12325 [Stellaceae bacterium]|nr:hypothetical protein [Stellaceae bacterium]